MSKSPGNSKATKDPGAAVRSDGDERRGEGQRPGRLHVQAWAFFLSLALVGFAADIATKAWAFDQFFPGDRPSEPYWLIDGVLGIQTLTNPGALFGFGSGYSHWFAGFSFVALALIVAWMVLGSVAGDRWLTAGLGMIAGGIMGNLYDRLGLGWRPGYAPQIRHDVRDWILVRLEGVPMFDPWPNFNIADSLLVCGAIALVLRALFHPRHADPESADGGNDAVGDQPGQ